MSSKKIVIGFPRSPLGERGAEGGETKRLLLRVEIKKAKAAPHAYKNTHKLKVFICSGGRGVKKRPRRGRHSPPERNPAAAPTRKGSDTGARSRRREGRATPDPRAATRRPPVGRRRSAQGDEAGGEGTASRPAVGRSRNAACLALAVGGGLAMCTSRGCGVSRGNATSGFTRRRATAVGGAGWASLRRRPQSAGGIKSRALNAAALWRRIDARATPEASAMLGEHTDKVGNVGRFYRPRLTTSATAPAPHGADCGGGGRYETRSGEKAKGGKQSKRTPRPPRLCRE